MCLSPSPFLAFLLLFRCAKSDNLKLLLTCAAFLSPLFFPGAAIETALPLDIDLHITEIAERDEKGRSKA